MSRASLDLTNPTNLPCHTHSKITVTLFWFDRTIWGGGWGIFVKTLVTIVITGLDKKMVYKFVYNCILFYYLLTISCAICISFIFQTCLGLKGSCKLEKSCSSSHNFIRRQFGVKMKNISI